MLSGTVTGAISGAVAASPIGVYGQIAINAAISGLEYSVNSVINNDFNFTDLGISLVVGGFAGWVGGDGLLYLGNKGLKSAVNVLAKSLKVKELSKLSVKVGLDYLLPITSGTIVNIMGGLLKIII